MGALLQFAHQLQTECCITCGVQFAMPDALVGQLRKNHGNFYCPNGHPQHYVGETEEQKLKKQLEAKERELVMERQRVASAQRSKAAIQGELTKARKRVGNGVCPCCNRTFKQLAAHMTAKHPNYAAEASEP